MDTGDEYFGDSMDVDPNLWDGEVEVSGSGAYEYVGTEEPDD